MDRSRRVRTAGNVAIRARTSNSRSVGGLARHPEAAHDDGGDRPQRRRGVAAEQKRGAQSRQAFRKSRDQEKRRLRQACRLRFHTRDQLSNHNSPGQCPHIPASLTARRRPHRHSAQQPHYGHSACLVPVRVGVRRLRAFSPRRRPLPPLCPSQRTVQVQWEKVSTTRSWRSSTVSHIQGRRTRAGSRRLDGGGVDAPRMQSVRWRECFRRFSPGPGQLRSFHFPWASPLPGNF